MNAGGQGRPLRFLVLVASAWIGFRVMMLWPQLDSAVDVLRVLAPIPSAIAQAATPPRTVSRLTTRRATRVSAPGGSGTLVGAMPPQNATVAEPLPAASALRSPRNEAAPVASTPLLPGLPHLASPAKPARAPTRWSGSAWLAARGGAGLAPGALGGQLGGSQAGVRLVYALSRKHRIALVGRVTSPLGAGLREASLGVEWQPTRLPVRIVAERRIAISGGRGGPAAGIVGGFGPVGIPLGFRLEGYGQAGVIHRTATEAYADGAVRAAHPLGSVGAITIDLGAGVWGGAQRGAARLDVGPRLGIMLPLGKRSVRLALDWRERVAGNAHPGSGPALTLGTDF